MNSPALPVASSSARTREFAAPEEPAMSLEQELRDHIVSACLPGEDPESIGLDDDLVDSGILDSMAIMQLVAYLEKQFGITIPTEEIDPEHFATVTALAGLVKSRQAAGGQPD
jgi:acyl carrier protein